MSIIFLCSLFVFFNVTVQKVNKDDLQVLVTLCLVFLIYAGLRPTRGQSLPSQGFESYQFKCLWRVLFETICRRSTSNAHTAIRRSNPSPVWSQSSSPSYNAYNKTRAPLTQCSPSLLSNHRGLSHHSQRQHNALPKWWKEILPRLELNEVVVRTRGESERGESLKWEKMLDARCSLAGPITHVKRTETALVSVSIQSFIPAVSSLRWLPSASPSASPSDASTEGCWPAWTQPLCFRTGNRHWI